MLAEKARRLYGKFCGTGGRGTCTESFAVYHIGRDEAAAAEDLFASLDEVVAQLSVSDPHGRLSATRGLAARIRRHLTVAVGPQSPAEPGVAADQGRTFAFRGSLSLSGPGC